MRFGRSISTVCAALLSGAAAAQGVRVAGMHLRPLATLGDTITITAMPSTLSVPLTPGAMSAASGSVSVTTTWSGISLLSQLTIYASLGSSSAALSGGSPTVFNIPSSCVYGKDSNGIPTSFTAFTASSPVTGGTAGLELYTLNTFLSLGGSHSDPIVLEVDLTGYPQLPAGTYTGTLTLSAEAF